jgi:acetylornithine deacetylase
MTDERWTQVHASLDALAPTYRGVLAGLVAIPSVVGAERPAQEYLRDVAAGAGLVPELYEVDRAAFADDPRAGMADGGAEPRPNLVATLGGGGGGHSLTLSGHVDVVPVGDLEGWSRDPYSASIEDGRLHGRGSLDMKGGLVAALHAVAALRHAGVPLAGDLVFESVIEEEATGNGALAARLRGPSTDGAIIPELSDERLLVATLGVIWAEITTRGHSAYVGRAGESVNAIDVMQRLLAGLRQLPETLNEAFDHPAYDGIEAPLTLNVGTIEGGDWPSSVPLTCRAGVRFSYPIGWSIRDAKRALEERVSEIAAEDVWMRDHAPAIRYHGFVAEGWDIGSDEPVVRAVMDAVSAETGEPAETGPLLGAADARFFRDAGIPAVYYGPSGEGQHGPDEWVDLASVDRVARVLARTALAWCG